MGAVLSVQDPNGKVMRFTSACVHGLRALVHLARHEGDGLISGDAIADAEGLSWTFLTKALTALAKARVVVASRGRRGGIRLARPARSITLLEVVEAVDGPVRGEAPRVGGRGHARFDARLQAVCDGAAKAVRRRLRRVTVADLAGEGE
jgi:Rrf2 family protein